MKIAQKLGLLVGTLLAALLVAILVLSAQVSSTSSQYDNLISGQIAQRAAARDMLVVFGKQVLDFQQILLQGNSADRYAPLKKTYDEQTAAVDRLTTQLLSKVDSHDPRLRTSLTQFQTSHAAVTIEYRAALERFVASGYKDLVGAAGTVTGIENFPNDLINNIVAYRQSSVDALIAGQSAAVSRRLKIIYGVSALLLLLAALAVTAVVRGIVRPVRSLTSSALDAANNRLPAVVAEIATLPAGAATPTLPRFEVTGRDELAELASALSILQDSAVSLALEQRRNEEANAETLVNLGRRNQSLLTRMLTYVTELERDERDSEALDKLFRLDHLTTRIRRNAESLLVLAGAKQTRTWSHPIAMDDVLRAALSEIEEYTRVTVHHMDHAKVHGSVAADLTHMIAELLENGTRFSPRDNRVFVVGRLTPSGYQFDLVDEGLGMLPEDLEQANLRIAQAGQRRPDTKVLGHHVVGRIAARRGIYVQLLPSDQAGLTAMILVPAAIISDAVIPATFREVAAVPLIVSPEPEPWPEPLPEPEPELSMAPMPIRAPIPVRTPSAPDWQTSAPPARPHTPAPPARPLPAVAASSAPVSAPKHPIRPLPERAPDRVPERAPDRAPAPVGRRVRGAQLGDLADSAASAHQPAPTVADARAVRSQLSSLQSGMATARRDNDFRPVARASAGPAPTPPEAPPVVTRRVRGAQLAELGDQISQDDVVPVRDPATIGRQLAGLQAGTARAQRKAGGADRSERYDTNDDDTRGSYQ